MFDAGATVLLTLRSPIRVEGRDFSQVWGAATRESLDGQTFVKVGGFEDAIFVAPSEIKYAVAQSHRPNGDDILVCGEMHAAAPEPPVEPIAPLPEFVPTTDICSLD
jgi:hypothetical protein